MRGLRHRYLVTIPLVLLLALTYVSCSKKTTPPPPPPPQKGSIAVISTPPSALIYLDDDSTGNVTPDTLTFTSADTHTVTLKLDGYEDWSTEVVVVLGQTKDVNATLQELQLTLTVNINGNGSVTISPDEQIYSYMDTVELTAVASEEWVFDSWTGDLADSHSVDTLIMTEDKVVNAFFGQFFYVTGTITFEGGEFVRPIALIDTSQSDSIVVLESLGFIADPSTGDFVIRFLFSDLDTVEAGIITGWDDTSQDGIWTWDEPRGWWDIDDDSSWTTDDRIPLLAGDSITGADVRIFLWPEPPEESPKRIPAGQVTIK